MNPFDRDYTFEELIALYEESKSKEKKEEEKDLTNVQIKKFNLFNTNINIKKSKLEPYLLSIVLQYVKDSNTIFTLMNVCKKFQTLNFRLLNNNYSLKSDLDIRLHENIKILYVNLNDLNTLLDRSTRFKDYYSKYIDLKNKERLTGFEKNQLSVMQNFLENLDISKPIIKDECNISNGDITNVIVPNFKTLKEVVIMPTIYDRINKIKAFYNDLKSKQTKLDSPFKIPYGQIIVPAECFANLNGYITYKFPDSIKLLGDSAFLNNINLKYIYLPKSIKIIGSNTFKGCSNLSTVEMSDSILCINNSTFKNCIKLQDINLSSSLKYIGNNCFEKCLSLEKINIPSKLEQFLKQPSPIEVIFDGILIVIKLEHL